MSMITFKQFCEEKHTSPLGDLGATISETLARIARMAADKHLEALLTFYEALAKKDFQIKEELENYKKDLASNKPASVVDKNDPDVISMQPADNASPPEEY